MNVCAYNLSVFKFISYSEENVYKQVAKKLNLLERCHCFIRDILNMNRNMFSISSKFIAY